MLKWTDEECYQDAIKYADEENIAPDGSLRNTYNPNAKWDWYQIGGRWAGNLCVPIACENCGNGEKSWGWGNKNPYECEYPQYKRVDSARIKDLVFPDYQKEYAKAKRFWELYIEDQEPITEEDKELLENHVDHVMPINLSNCMQDSFLSYAMSVIVARALPDVRDGLKPVQRRILYTMSELGVYSDKPYKKSARIVGDVMGKYHPHGDSAIYEAMVRMAQDFSYRYTLVEGHGNFGSVDGDGAAHMRYTEARLSKIANEMLKDLGKNTVDFMDNYDGSEQEPVVLPARFPNILVNGASGIAVGMATSIPTHNLTEVINATLALIKDPNITIDQLMDYIPAPDFPTGGIIVGHDGMKAAYTTGRGKVCLRAKAEIEEDEDISDTE